MGAIEMHTHEGPTYSPLKIFLYAVLFTTFVGCGSDRDGATLVQGSNGVASINGVAVVGDTLSASIADNEGVQPGSESYQWYSDGDAIDGATSSSYTLTANEGGEAVTVVVRYTDTSGLRETVESAPTDIQAAFALGALYVHGLVDGAVCEISAVDASGVAAVPALASGTTASGLASFGDLVPVDGAALISCVGGTYVDEATGLVLDAPATRAVVNVDGDAIFTVSPLTEIATQLAEAAGDLNTATSTHNNAIGINFGVTVAGDITEIAPTDLATMAAINDEAGRYATAIALISQVDATDAGNSAADIINNLGTDLADGTFSPSALVDFNQAVVDVQTSSVAGNLDIEALLDVQAAINNEPVAAVFGDLNATIPNDQVAPLQGSVTVTDVNFGEDRVVPQTDVVTTYGMFSIEENGDWTYTLDTTDAEVAGLEVGASVNDIIALTSIDDTMANLVMRIVKLTQVAKITNNINGDTGELRRDLDPHLLQGKLSFSFLKTEALADDGNQKDAYVTLYGASGSVHESLVDLRIQGQGTNDDGSIREPRFFVRNTDSDLYPGDIIEAPFTPGQWYDIEIMWDMSQANQVTIVIDGEVLGGGAFSTAAVVDPDFTDLDQWFSEGVQRVQWRFGDNGTVIPFGSFFVDNVAIYSDTAGTTLQFADDFEGYFVGDSFSGSENYPNSVDAVVSVYDAGAGAGNTEAAFFNLVGAINSDSTDVLMDTVRVIDPDPGENLLVEQTDTPTQYGTFSILASGDWEYTLDTTHPTIAAMVQGDRETDTIPITSFDGSAAELVITINGVGGAGPSGENNVAVIIDTDPGDTGELRYALDAAGPLASGRLEAKVKRLDDTLGDGDAFITLFNSATNNAGAILDFRIRDDSFGVRAPAGIDTSTLPHTLDAFMDVRITWEYPDGDPATTLPLVTISVDGVSLAPFTLDNDAYGGVTHVAFRFGTNGNVSGVTGKFSVDDLAIYSDKAGFTEVFSDDFESYLDGDSLDDDNAASPYHSNTSEATVETIAGASGPGTPGNQIAEIIDTDPGDTGELRYALDADGPLVAGRLEVAVKRLDDAVGDGDAFITLFNENTNNDGAILDFRIRDSSFGVRNPSATDTSALPHTLDAFMDVIVTWEYPTGDPATTLPEVTISVDGVSLAPFTADNNSFNGVTHVAFRFGTNGNVSGETGIFSVDELAIYSDTDGMTGVFSDDFESYLEGDSLDTDNAASPYHSNTSEATVGAEEGGAGEGGLGTPGNQFARIADRAANDAGELRYKPGAAIVKGRITAQVLREAGAKAESPSEDAQIAIYGSSTSTSPAMAYITLDISGDDYDLRDSSGSSGGGSEAGFAEGQIIDFEIAWDATAATDTVAPLVTVTIDGQVAFGGQFSSKSTDLTAVQNGLETIQFRIGGTADITAFGLLVDDFVVYSSDSGSEVEVFRDDFESYTVGNSLDPDADTNGTAPIAGAVPDPATPYNSSSFDVFVVEE
jgi:VCBS repeat-containing protein